MILLIPKMCKLQRRNEVLLCIINHPVITEDEYGEKQIESCHQRFSFLTKICPRKVLGAKMEHLLSLSPSYDISIAKERIKEYVYVT